MENQEVTISIGDACEEFETEVVIINKTIEETTMDRYGYILEYYQ